MKQIITRVDDNLAEALKRQARRSGESVNAYVNDLLRAAVAEPGAPRHEWKAAAIANGQLMSRANAISKARNRARVPGAKLRTPAGYASQAVSDSRDER